jgi:hypothetical protein
VEGSLVSGNLCVQSLFDQSSSLYSGFSLLNGSHDSVTVLEFTAPFPENLGVIFHLLNSFTLNFTTNVFNIITTILFIQSDKLIEITITPATVAYF